MIRIAHCADLHLGYRALTKQAEGRNARALDVERAFTRLTDGMCDARPDLALIAGDIFHMPRPPYGAVALFIDGVNRLIETGAVVAAIAGNHDTSTLRTRDDVFTVIRASCPGLLMASGDEQVYETILTRKGGINLNLIASRKLRNYYPPTAEIRPDLLNIMVVHGIASDIPKAKIAPAPGEEQIADALLAPAYDYIAMGDWHLYGQVRPNAWYAGSSERFGWGDLEAIPGWLLAEVGKFEESPRVTHVDTPARPMVDLGRLDVQDSEPRAVVRVIMDECANIARHCLFGMDNRPAITPDETMVRVTLTNVPDRAYARQARDQLAHAKGNWWHVSVADELRGKEGTISDEAEWSKPDPLAEFGPYVDTLTTKSEAFRTAFREKGMAALTLAAEREREREMAE